MKKILALLIIFSAVTFLSAKSQINNVLMQKEELGELFETYKVNEIGNKLFIHTDREIYSAGEVIWFKGYIFYPSNNILDTIPANLYIEIFDFNGNQVDSKLFKVEGGVTSGNTNLDPNLRDGNYFLRAQTDIMQNLDDNNYFIKYFYINNPKYANRISRREIRLNKQFNSELAAKRNEINLSLYPEGGTLVENLKNILVAKATNGLGEGIERDGKIFDSKSNVIASFTTSEYGLAAIEFTPKKGENYYVVLENNTNNRVAVPIPTHTSQGVVFSIAASLDSIVCTLTSNLLYDNVLVLLGRKENNLVYHKVIELSENGSKTFSIANSDLETGIVLFELYDLNSHQLLSQRPVFINNNDQTFIIPRSQVQQIELDRVLAVQIITSDYNGKPNISKLSVAVTAGEFVQEPIKNDIFKFLNLYSTLTNINHIPSSLLSLDAKEKYDQLDLLLITGNIRRANLSDILAGHHPKVSYNRKLGAELRGIVIDPSTNQPVSSVGLVLKRSIGDHKPYRAKSDEKGIFLFKGLDIPDSLSVEITSELIAGRVRPKIELLHKEELKLNYVMNPKTQDQKILVRGKDRVKVRTRPSSQTRTSSPYGVPDQTIVINERVVYRNVYEVLRERAVGLIVSGSSVMFRGPTSIVFSNDPLFIRDNVVISTHEFLSQDPVDIERIDLYRGASAVFWGARGANGVIVSYSKRGQPVAKPYSEFIINGFAIPEPFTAYKDKIAEELAKGNLQTVHWEPNILTDENGVATFYFFVLPGVGKYKLDIQGISNDGSVAMGEFIIGR